MKCKHVSRARGYLFVGLLLMACLHTALAVNSASRLSLVYDEPAHMVAGYSYLLAGDQRLQPENGWLPQSLIGLGLMAGGVERPVLEGEPWEKSDVWAMADRWLFGEGTGMDVGEASFWGRLPISLLSGALVVLIGLTAARVFGTAAGWIAGGVATFSPTLLAHGALATSDTTAALMFLAVVLTFWGALHRVTPARVALCFVAIALLALSKFSALLAIPMTLVMVAARVLWGRPMMYGWGRQLARTRGRWRQLAVGSLLIVGMAVSAWAGVWLAFGLGGPSEQPGFVSYFRAADIEHFSGLTYLVNEWLRRNHLLPEAYGYGLHFTLVMSQQRGSFLNGELSPNGFRWFFPYAFVAKTPLVVLLGMVLAGVTLCFRMRPSRRRLLYRVIPLGVLAVVYVVVALRSNLNIGHRHLLPVYPVLFILIGAVGQWAWRNRGLAYVGGASLVVALAIESSLVFPNYLSFFNQAAGGPSQGYKHLVDSSLDWGQNLPQLREWIGEHPELIEHDIPIYLYLFGLSQPRAYGLDMVRPLSISSPPGFEETVVRPLEPGVYAVSATSLQTVYVGFMNWSQERQNTYEKLRYMAQRYYKVRDDPAALQKLADEVGGDDIFGRALLAYVLHRSTRLMQYLQRLEPEAQAGYSINIYYLTAEQLDEALNGPPAAWLGKDFERNPDATGAPAP